MPNTSGINRPSSTPVNSDNQDLSRDIQSRQSPNSSSSADMSVFEEYLGADLQEETGSLDSISQGRVEEGAMEDSELLSTIDDFSDDSGIIDLGMEDPEFAPVDYKKEIPQLKKEILVNANLSETEKKTLSDNLDKILKASELNPKDTSKLDEQYQTILTTLEDAKLYSAPVRELAKAAALEASEVLTILEKHKVDPKNMMADTTKLMDAIKEMDPAIEERMNYVKEATDDRDTALKEATDKVQTNSAQRKGESSDVDSMSHVKDYQALWDLKAKVHPADKKVAEAMSDVRSALMPYLAAASGQEVKEVSADGAVEAAKQRALQANPTDTDPKIPKWIQNQAAYMTADKLTIGGQPFDIIDVTSGKLRLSQSIDTEEDVQTFAIPMDREGDGAQADPKIDTYGLAGAAVEVYDGPGLHFGNLMAGIFTFGLAQIIGGDEMSIESGINADGTQVKSVANDVFKWTALGVAIVASSIVTFGAAGGVIGSIGIAAAAGKGIAATTIAAVAASTGGAIAAAGTAGGIANA